MLSAPSVQVRRVSPVRLPLLIGVALASISLAGCAGGASQALSSMSLADAAADRKSTMTANMSPMQRALVYWSQKYAENPGNAEAAVAYSRNLRAAGEKRKAFSVLQHAAIKNPQSREITSEYGRAALAVGEISLSKKLLARAADPAKPDWKIISAQGAALARDGHYKDAQGKFVRALELKPNHPSLLNNLALAYALGGEIDSAEDLLRKASSNGRNVKKIRDNLALILGVQGKFDESKRLATVRFTEGKAQSDSEFLKRWVKASPQTAPRPRADATVLADAGLRSTTTPTMISPWDTKVETAALGGWQTEVRDGQ